MFYDYLLGHVEALLFASGTPISEEKIATILSIPRGQVADLIQKLQDDFVGERRGLMIQKVAGGYQLATKPELIEVVNKLADVTETKLTTAALETLAIIAFKQPVTKPEIEAIRGVNIDRVMATLLDYDLIREAGRKEALGRPILYVTTENFLRMVGLNSLRELPDLPEGALELPVEEEQVV